MRWLVAIVLMHLALGAAHLAITPPVETRGAELAGGLVEAADAAPAPAYAALRRAVFAARGHGLAAELVPAPAGDHALRWQHGVDEARDPAYATWRLLRLAGLLLGCASVAATYLLGRLLAPERRSIAITGGLVLACLPTWNAVHGAVHGVPLAAACAHGALLAAAWATRGRDRRWLAAGLLVGATCSADPAGAAIAASALLAALATPGRGLGPRLQRAAWLVLGALPWLAWPGFAQQPTLAADPTRPPWAVATALFGEFGGAGLGLPWLPWVGTAATLALAAGGWVALARRGDLPLARPIAVLTYTACSLGTAAAVTLSGGLAARDGRALLLVAGPMMLLTAVGLDRAWRGLPRRAFAWLGHPAMALLPLLPNVLVLTLWVRPALDARLARHPDPGFRILRAVDAPR